MSVSSVKTVDPVDARPVPDRGLPTRPGKCVYDCVSTVLACLWFGLCLCMSL